MSIAGGKRVGVVGKPETHFGQCVFVDAAFTGGIERPQNLVVALQDLIDAADLSGLGFLLRIMVSGPALI